MSGKKLSWQEIKSDFNQEWVELVDFDWPEGEPFPVTAKVKAHASNRKDFYKQLELEVSKPKDCALLFVGDPTDKPEGGYLSPFKIVSID